MVPISLSYAMHTSRMLHQAYLEVYKLLRNLWYYIMRKLLSIFTSRSRLAAVEPNKSLSAQLSQPLYSGHVIVKVESTQAVIRSRL